VLEKSWPHTLSIVIRYSTVAYQRLFKRPVKPYSWGELECSSEARQVQDAGCGGVSNVIGYLGQFYFRPKNSPFSEPVMAGSASHLSACLQVSPRSPHLYLGETEGIGAGCAGGATHVGRGPFVVHQPSRLYTIRSAIARLFPRRISIFESSSLRLV